MARQDRVHRASHGWPRRSSVRRWCLAAGAVLAGPALLGSVPAGAGDPTGDITMVDNRFAPVVAVVAQGQSVEFTNFGQVLHDARDGTGLDLFTTGYVEPPESATIGPLPGAGVYRYYCTFHPEMVGRVRVPVRASHSQRPGGLAGHRPMGGEPGIDRAGVRRPTPPPRHRPLRRLAHRGHRGLGAVLALGAWAVGDPRSRPPAAGRCVLRLVTAEVHPGHLTTGRPRWVGGRRQRRRRPFP